MLLANIAVARRIYKHFPEKAILRRHPSPNQLQIQQLADSIKEYGFDFDSRTSNSIQVCVIIHSHLFCDFQFTLIKLNIFKRRFYMIWKDNHQKSLILHLSHLLV